VREGNQQIKNHHHSKIKKKKCKEGATWQKYCVNSTPGGGVRGEKEVEMESYKVGNPKG